MLKNRRDFVSESKERKKKFRIDWKAFCQIDSEKIHSDGRRTLRPQCKAVSAQHKDRENRQKKGDRPASKTIKIVCD